MSSNSPIQWPRKRRSRWNRVCDALLRGIELMGRYQIDCPGSEYYVPPAVGDEGGDWWGEGYGVPSAAAPRRAIKVVARR
ncbi:MAG TPA: hypothetical protein VH951_08385 [Dehalococcoidia bacterium]